MFKIGDRVKNTALPSEGEGVIAFGPRDSGLGAIGKGTDEYCVKLDSGIVHIRTEMYLELVVPPVVFTVEQVAVMRKIAQANHFCDAVSRFINKVNNDNGDKKDLRYDYV